jgi:hypothetical protein
MNRSSKNRLTEKETFLFPGDTLFDKIGRTVCRAGCLPRKELFEAWEVARRVRRRFRGGRVVDLACGHGLTAMIMLVLDSSSQEAIAVDRKLPPSSARLYKEMIQSWPRLEESIEFVENEIENISLTENDIVVSVHACGTLTDLVIEQAVKARARLAVLPCCHDLDYSDQGDLNGWLDGPLSVDVTRALSLRQQGYRIYTQQIPAEITPKNRLLLAEPIE